MKLKNFILLSPLIFFGCGENENFSVGVSIGGSGTGSTIPVNTGGTGPISPLPSEEDDPDNEINFLIWSNGKAEMLCGKALISIQFLHSQTEQPLEQGYGSFISKPTKENPTNVSLLITTENLGQEPLYEYFSDCRPNLKLLDSENNEQKSSQEFTCPNDNIIREYKPQETKVYKYKFTVPYDKSENTVSYFPDFSFGGLLPKEQRSSCEPLNYQIKVQEY